MAISVSMVVSSYKNYSVEELEKELNDLVLENFYFETKELQIKRDIDCVKFVSRESNCKSQLIGIQRLLKEKTGKDYPIKTKSFKLTFKDYLDYVSNNYVASNNKKAFKWFFRRLFFVSSYFKKPFLLDLCHDENSFLELLNEVTKKFYFAFFVYKKYNKKVSMYMKQKRCIG